MKAIVRFFKFIFWTAVVLVLLALAAVLTLPLWVGPTVTGTANYAVPKIVKTGFSLDRFAFNQYKGTFGMGALKMANPEGYPPENCLELDSLDVKFDPVSCFTKKVHVEKISLDGLRVVVDFPKAGNFMKIAENAQGDDYKEKEEKEPTEEEKKNATKVVIDVLEFKNLKVTYGAAPIILPDFTIKGIGKAEGGVTWEEAWDEAFKAVCDKLGIVVGVVIDAGKAVLDTGAQTAGAVLNVGTNTVSNAIKAASSLDAAGAVGAVKDGANAAAGAVGSGASAVMDAVGSLTESAAGFAGGAKDAAGGAASGAADAVGKGLNAVGDGAGAAVDAVKGLFK